MDGRHGERGGGAFWRPVSVDDGVYDFDRTRYYYGCHLHLPELGIKARLVWSSTGSSIPLSTELKVKAKRIDIYRGQSSQLSCCSISPNSQDLRGWLASYFEHFMRIYGPAAFACRVFDMGNFYSSFVFRPISQQA